TIAVATINARAAEATAAAAVHPTVAVTATTKPTLFINAASANCRSGPGNDFGVIAALAAGTSADLVGKDSVHNYWIVIDPASHKQCWVQIQDATPAGSFSDLPEMTPQPVTIAVPGKPNKGAWNFACDNTTLTTVLAWYPPSGSVNGYRIFREGSQIADVPATEKSYTEKIPFRYGSNMSYAVAAYNEAGTSQQLTWNFHCP
ncbi:MAG: hypothetical protein ACM3MF_03430, partial [Anaerolineae bacterium]